MARTFRQTRMLVPTLICLMLGVLAGCGVPGMVAQGHALPTTLPSPTARVLPPARFPQDEAPHKNLTEWWYYTGHVLGKDTSGIEHAYGFELTFFQVLRGGLPPVYIGHYAVTDLTRQEFHYDQRLLLEPQAVLSDGTITTGFNLAIGNWAMQGVNGTDKLDATMAHYSLQLTLQGAKPPAIHGGTGLIQYGIFGYSYYYSRTHMQVTGALIDHDQTIAVTGLAWMDHQWGDFITTAGGGWDWFSVQLTNDTEYMIYFLRDAQGKIVQTVGTRIAATGQTTDLTNIPIAEQVTGHWQSPATRVVYPAGWVLTLPEGTLAITPALANQELVTAQTTGNTYWEGDCHISGTLNQQAVTGDGYTELTGYQAP